MSVFIVELSNHINFKTTHELMGETKRSLNYTSTPSSCVLRRVPVFALFLLLFQLSQFFDLTRIHAVRVVVRIGLSQLWKVLQNNNKKL